MYYDAFSFIQLAFSDAPVSRPLLYWMIRVTNCIGVNG